MAEKEIPVVYFFLFGALVTLIALIAWWVFGSSPTTENISLGVTFLGVVLTWASIRSSSEQTRLLRSLKQDHIEQTQMLKTML